MSRISDWMTTSEIMRDHPIAGSVVWFNPNSTASTLKDVMTALQSLHGKLGLRATITGVIIQNCQIAGYKVLAIDGQQYIGGTNDFNVDKRDRLDDSALSTTEDRIIVHEVTKARIRNIVRHWQKSKEYEGSYWIGIEKIYGRLAPIVAMGSIKNAHMADTNPHWRLLLPIAHNPVIIDFHTTIANNWMIRTNVESPNHLADDIDNIYLIGHPDPWKRVMLWTLRTLETLEDRQNNIDYRRARQDIITRMGLASILHEMKIPLLAQLQHNYETLIHSSDGSRTPDYITIIVSEWDLPVGKESFYMPPHYDTDLGWIFWGTIVMHPKLAAMPKRAAPALVHQLSHSIFATSCDADCTKKMPQDMRDLIKTVS